jgi:hypothetical protein
VILKLGREKHTAVRRLLKISRKLRRCSEKLGTAIRQQNNLFLMKETLRRFVLLLDKNILSFCTHVTNEPSADELEVVPVQISLEMELEA